MVARARLICGEEHVVGDPSVLSVYRSDGRIRGGPLPLAAALPGTAAEVAGLVSACLATGIAYVVRGAGTSIGGGALPRDGALMIVMTRMRRVLTIGDGGEVTVEPGAPAAALPPVAGARWFAHTAPIGTVGGHVAETPGIANVSALELVDPEGRRIGLRSGQPGYDLVGAFAGSRGRVGIAVAITLRAVLEA